MTIYIGSHYIRTYIQARLLSISLHSNWTLTQHNTVYIRVVLILDWSSLVNGPAIGSNPPSIALSRLAVLDNVCVALGYTVTWFVLAVL